MNTEAQYYRVGLFVLVGIASIVVLALLLSGSRLLADRQTYETYFDESVQGLEVGSPVKLRGVPLGQVSAIGLVADYYPLSPTEQAQYGQRVVVRMEIDLAKGGGDYLPALIDSGLRLRLSANPLTGTAYVDADVVSAPRTPMQIVWEPEYPYIYSRQSVPEQFLSEAGRILERLDELNVERALANLDSLLVTLREQFGALDLKGAQGDLRELLGGLQKTNAQLQKAIGGDNLEAFGQGARQAVERLNATLSEVQGIVEGGRYDVGVALENLRVASENIRDLSETARAYPSLMILGEPPEPGPIPTR